MRGHCFYSAAMANSKLDYSGKFHDVTLEYSRKIVRNPVRGSGSVCSVRSSEFSSVFTRVV